MRSFCEVDAHDPIQESIDGGGGYYRTGGLYEERFDLGWEWNTFTLTDKSGATIDKGKYVTVFARRNEK
jgi:hypothetical protein